MKYKPSFSNIILTLTLTITQLFTINTCIASKLDNSNDSIKAVENNSSYEQQAQALPADKIYEIIKNTEQAKTIKQSLTNAPLSNLYDEDRKKIIAFVEVLKQKAKANDSKATFYYATYILPQCIESKKNSLLKNDTENLCNAIADNLKLTIDNDNNPHAMYLLAILYQEGIGITKSKYMATYWFSKAGLQYIKQQDKENALVAIDKALFLTPDYKEALDTQNILNKNSK